MARNKPRVKWNQHAVEDDIRYRGPLNYRHFKIIGWTLFVLKIMKGPLTLAAGLDPMLQSMLATPLVILDIITPLSVFFLLIASMSQLLVKQDYKSQMLTNGGAALAVILIFELLYHRYIVGAVDAFVGNRIESLTLINTLFSAANPAGFMAFNVFLDLFLCTCVMFFLNYEPQKVFVGDKRKWFRCFALLPVIYEFVCLWLKVMANAGDFYMPLSSFPFLTAKPPMMFFVFCAMVIYQMRLEKRFCAGGRTHEEFVAYLDTNRGVFHFAKFAAILCVIAGAVDFIIVIVTIIGELNANNAMVQTLTKDAFNAYLNKLLTKYINAGFGGAADLLLFAPIMLLFDYRRAYKSTKVEIAIPIVSVIVLLFFFMEYALAGITIGAQIFNDEIMPQVEQTLEQLVSEDATEEADVEELMALLGALAQEESDAEAPQAEGSAEEESATEGQAPQAEQPAESM